MTKYDYHIIVIGAGSGGLVVASAAASLGAKVALIEGHKMGGDCLNYGCIPSKTFLKSAHLASEIRDSQRFGLNASLNDVDLSKVMARVHTIISEIEPHDSKQRYESLGITVYEGYGTFIDCHTVQINDQAITGKTIVISTGSTAVVPPIEGLDQVPYLSNHTIFDLKQLPKHLIVMGAGPIGLELGQGFRHLGSNVTIVDKLASLFGKDDPEVGPVLEKRLVEEGIQLKLSCTLLRVEKSNDDILIVIEKNGQEEKIKGNALLLSLGRRPVTDTLNLAAAQVKLNQSGFIVTNSKLQTSTSHIYACGDVVGPYQFTHMAGYQAGIVIRNCVFKLGAKVDYRAVPWTTYTKPEVAHVGYTEPWAKNEGLYHDHILVNLNRIDRAKVENDQKDGFLKLILGKKNRIIGATLVGDKAGELIVLATLAIKKKLKPSVFMSMIFSYPTEAEIFKFAALDLTKKGFKPWMKKIIQAIL